MAYESLAYKLSKKLKKQIKEGKFLEALETYEKLKVVLETYRDAC